MLFISVYTPVVKSGCRLQAWMTPTKDYSAILLPIYILEMSGIKCSPCDDWLQVGIKFYFLFHSQFPDKTYSTVVPRLILHTAQTHSKVAKVTTHA